MQKRSPHSRKNLITKPDHRGGRKLGSPTLRASQILEDYEYWFREKYKRKPGTYLTNARSFLRTYRAGSLNSQIISYGENKSYSLRSILKRFLVFLEEKRIDVAVNDLNDKKLPRAENPYVMVFLHHVRDRLRGDYSLATYATVLNHYFRVVKRPENVNKRTIEAFIFSRDLSDYTVRLYKAILKAFCKWVATYQQIPNGDLNKNEKAIKRALLKISPHSLREIAEIKVRNVRADLKGYHKESLSSAQRQRLLTSCTSQRDRAIVALMAWNGLRTVEVTRLAISHCHFKEAKLEVWGKGRSAKSRQLIKFFKVPQRELKKYLAEINRSRGKVFADFSRVEIDTMINKYLQGLKLRGTFGKYSPHSLRHTAGQLMYDKGIKLEFIQKTLRHATMENTLVYAQRAIDRTYFKKMPANV